jgi:hypothetical protein
MDVRLFETLHQIQAAVGAARETGAILGFAVRTEHEFLCAPERAEQIVPCCARGVTFLDAKC